MSEKGYISASRQILREKVVKHLGTASVRLDVLKFPHSTSLDLKNIERLKNLFEAEHGCRAAEIVNRIPAIIPKAQFDEAVRFSGVDPGQLRHDSVLNHARLEFPDGFHLECLHGRHRVEAAMQSNLNMSPHNKRWVVDLFAADINQNTKHFLIDEYSNEKKPGDGEFFLKIRTYQGYLGGERNKFLEDLWWARLGAVSNAATNSRKEGLQILIDHKEFLHAFDSLHHIPALYSGLRLTLIKKMVSMKCHEEHISYIKHIKQFFDYVFEGDRDAMRKLDVPTLEAIQLTAPGASGVQAAKLLAEARSGKVFGTFDIMRRESYLNKLIAATTDCQVPSLFTFFENRKWLHGPAECIKRLTHMRKGTTIYSFLEKLYFDSKSNLENGHDVTNDEFDFVYRLLWLFGIREHIYLPPEYTKKLAKPGSSPANEAVLFEFAVLAKHIGLESNEVHEILRHNPDRIMARRFLKTARRPNLYRYSDIEASINTLVNVFNTAIEVRACGPVEYQGSPEDEFIGDMGDNQEVDEIPNIRRRTQKPTQCGLPNVLDHIRDKPLLRLSTLHNTIDKQGEILDSFFVQRSTYFAYFGRKINYSIQDLERWEHQVQATINTQIHQLQCEAQPEGIVQLPVFDQHSASLGNLSRQAALAKEMIRSLEDKEREHQNKIERLTDSIMTAEGKLEKIHEETQQALTAKDSIQQMLASLEGHQQSLQHNIKELEQTHQNYHTISEQNEKAQEQQQKRLDHLSKAIQKLTNDKNARKSSLRDVESKEKKQIEFQSNLVTWQDALKQKELELEDRKIKQDSLQLELERSLESLNSDKQQLEISNHKLNTAQELIEFTKTQLRLKQSENLTLEAKLDTERQAWNSEKEHSKVREEKLAFIEKTLLSTQEQLKAKEIEHVALQTALETQQELMACDKQRLEVDQKLLLSIQEQLKVKESEHDTLRATLDAERESRNCEKRQYSKEIKTHTDRITELEEEVKRQQEIVSSLQLQYQISQTEGGQSLKVIEFLRKQNDNKWKMTDRFINLPHDPKPLHDAIKVAKAYQRKGYHFFDEDMRILNLSIVLPTLTSGNEYKFYMQDSWALDTTKMIEEAKDGDGFTEEESSKRAK